MKDIFVNFKIANELINLGFNEKCIATINNLEVIHIKGTKRKPSGAVLVIEIDVPTYEQVFNWLFENYKILISNTCNCDYTKITYSLKYSPFSGYKLSNSLVFLTKKPSNF